MKRYYLLQNMVRSAMTCLPAGAHDVVHQFPLRLSHREHPYPATRNHLLSAAYRQREPFRQCWWMSLLRRADYCSWDDADG
jgi:hypothetical protein